MRHLRNPQDVLNSLTSKATSEHYHYERLYRNLFNPNFYLRAYQNIYGNRGSMTAGVDGATMNGMGMERIHRIIAAMRDHSYQPNPVRRQYIPKKNGKLRPLGIPSTDDKLVQEVVRMILESIYEPTFTPNSHGFRPGRSCHSALAQIQKTYTGVKWFIEGDIKGCFDNINHHKLVDILRRRIRDEHFLALIWKFLRAGYLEERTWNATYSGAAQGSVISPILANIYMNELDVFMADYKSEFDKGEKRANHAEYNRAKSRWYCYRQTTEKNRSRYTEEELKSRNEEIRRRYETWSSLPSMEPMDASYRRVLYCRYADDFLIGVIGSKKDAKTIREDVRAFLKENLSLELSMEKTLITAAKDRAKFLGYDVTISRRSRDFVRREHNTSRRSEGVVKLYVPKEKWMNRLLDHENMVIRKDIHGKEHWHPVARSSFVNRTPVEIIGGFNAEIRGLYNYYALANNVSVLNKYYYIMQYSMYHTFACKYRCSMGKVIEQHKKNGIFGIDYETPSGETKRIEFYHDGFARREPRNYAEVDNLPKQVTYYRPHPKELIVRMLRGTCELCGKTGSNVKVHQVKALRELDASTPWGAKMLKMHRKTLVVCDECFAEIQTDM